MNIVGTANSSPRLLKLTRLPRLGVWMILAVLALATIAVYWPATHNDFVNFDDPAYVCSNPQVQNGLTVQNLHWAFTHSVAGNWHPLTMLSHMLDCEIYGLNPVGHHATSILWHALNIALLFWLLHNLTGAAWRSAAVAALFACHPLHVQSVAWVAERKDVLSTFFGLLTLCFYLRYVRSLPPAGETPTVAHGKHFRLSTSSCFWLAWLSLALGLMCKSMLVTWPFLMLLLDYWPLNRFKNADTCQASVEGKNNTAFPWASLIVEKIPGFILIGIFSVVTFIAQKNSGATDAMTGGLPLSFRCGNAVMSYAWYILKTFWPSDLAVFYPYPAHLNLGKGILSGTLLSAISFYAWSNRRRFPFLFIGWLWFLGTLVPVIGIVQVGSQAMADRYAYIPSIGLFISIVWGLYELSRAWQRHPVILSVAGLGAIAFFCVLTRQQITYWQNSETLFQHDLTVTEDNFIARVNLAVFYRNQNRVDDAVKQFQVIARHRPDYVEGRTDLANLIARQGRTDEAIRQLQDIIKLKPEFAEAHCSLGRIFADHGRGDEAMRQFQEALRLKPNYGEAHYALGRLLAARGQPDDAVDQLLEAERDQFTDAAVYFEAGQLLAQKGLAEAAITQYQTSLRLNPNLSAARNGLGKLLAVKGQIDEAGFQFQEAIRSNSNDAEAYNNLGNVLAIKGQADAAAAQFQKSIRLKPDYADPHFNLGSLFANNGRISEAIACFQGALRLDTNDPEIHYKLGNLYIKQNETREAIHELQEAIRLRPDYRDAHFNLGGLFFKNNRIEQSIAEFQTVTKISPALPSGHTYLGMALSSKGDVTNAIAELQEAIRLKPDYVLAHDKLGLIFLDVGRIDDAIAQFQEVVRLQPDYAEAGTNLSRAMKLKSVRR